MMNEDVQDYMVLSTGTLLPESNSFDASLFARVMLVANRIRRDWEVSPGWALAPAAACEAPVKIIVKVGRLTGPPASAGNGGTIVNESEHSGRGSAARQAPVPD
jgi:hypothetical protein